MIVVTPNQSASWHSNVVLLFALAVPVLGIAVVFAALGAWLVLPFAGLEVVALAIALYRVNWQQQCRQVITLSGDSVWIDKGHYLLHRRWHFPRQATGLTVTTEHHPWEGPQLCVHDRHEWVSLGEFLNRDDSLLLIELLQREFRVRTIGVRSVQSF